MTLTKFGDIRLTISQARALHRWLDTLATDEDRAVEFRLRQEEAQREADAEARATRIYEKVRELAADTARRDGRTTIPLYLQARAAWEAFTASEGYHDRYDVDERWEPDADDAETWANAYVAALEGVRRP